MGGYSIRELVEKLGIKEGMFLYLGNATHDFKNRIAILPRGCKVTKELKGPFDFMLWFSTSKDELEETFPKLKKELAPAGLLWISWPKGTSKIEKDLNENSIREIGLKEGLVDVKVIAIDDDWSGLKFVYRLKDRS